MMFTVDLYGNRGLDSRSLTQSASLILGKGYMTVDRDTLAGKRHA